MTIRPGEVLREPSAEDLSSSRLAHYLAWLAERGRRFGGYEELWQWSISDQTGFWGSLWDYFAIDAETPYDFVMPESPSMPGVRFFGGARLNYVHHALRHFTDDRQVVTLSYSQTRKPLRLDMAGLRDQVGRARAGFMRLGVGKGDRVAAYLPNIPETLVAFLAAASLGAVFSSCAPELGPRSVLDRFTQIEPTVLLAVDGYRYGDKEVDRRSEVGEVRKGLSKTLKSVVHVPYLGRQLDDTLGWEDLLAEAEPLSFTPVSFDHPLYILYSSGTTGLPKAIVHTHGGILVEHLKNHVLSWDLRPGDRLMWFTTTAWMMWNALVSALLCGASIVQLDGNPVHPDLAWQWSLAEETGATCLGVSSGYLMACRRAGLRPGELDLRVRQLGCAGSPLPLDGFVYATEELGPDCMLNVGSGGTDLCSGIVQGNPLLPVLAGEMSGRCLGVAAFAFDGEGRPVVDELGELVITKPLPSMPSELWNDPGGRRCRAAYFEHYPGIWRQGDWVRFSARGSAVVTGRSDATLNRGGVRLGTGELYGVISGLEEISDCLVVHLEDSSGAGGPGELVCFVVLAGEAELGDDLRHRIATVLARELSPRHVPDTIVAVAKIPYTLTGKKLEVPIKRILQGVPASEVASPDALSDPGALQCYVDYAAARVGEAR